MEFTAQFLPLAEVQADWLIVGAWEDENLTGAVAVLNDKLAGLLSRLREKKDISGKANDLTPLLGHAGLAADRLLVVGLGKRAKAEALTRRDKEQDKKQLPPELGGPKGPEPTRYGDWERKGIVSDF